MSTSTAGLRYAIASLPTEVAARVRKTLADDFGNQLSARESDPVPCRSCLRISKHGERVILFAYRPFETAGPYSEIGPIFIHAEDCEAYARYDRFPEDFRPCALTMRGYNEFGSIEAAELSVPGYPEASLGRPFSNERVRFVHVRNPAWGCYDFRVDRVI